MQIPSLETSLLPVPRFQHLTIALHWSQVYMKDYAATSCLNDWSLLLGVRDYSKELKSIMANRQDNHPLELVRVNLVTHKVSTIAPVGKKWFGSYILRDLFWFLYLDDNYYYWITAAGTLNVNLPSTYDWVNGIEYVSTSSSGYDNATITIYGFDVSSGELTYFIIIIYTPNLIPYISYHLLRKSGFYNCWYLQHEYSQLPQQNA